MSESKRRKAEIEELKQSHEQWVSELTPEERVVAAISERAHARIVRRMELVSACYLLAFFLHELFAEDYGIRTDLIVGWINDGEWPGVASHAWLEMGGKKIDISLGKMDLPESQPVGDVIVLDRVVRPGAARYTYYREAPAEALAYIDEAIRKGEIPAAIVEAKNLEHAYMLELSKTPGGVKRYLSGAPPGRSYSALQRILQ